ncbi:unnamed protein product [Meloidogyne enterolobii]|uniref:Uncharacterized protein n=1 Tax=Meloidogyne enterolobii TaxID=390850 RepID=A0ACB0ZNV9_MELEN
MRWFLECFLRFLKLSHTLAPGQGYGRLGPSCFIVKKTKYQGWAKSQNKKRNAK